MNDLDFLESTLSTFIDISIKRVKLCKRLQYTYKIGISDLKAVTGRTRLRANTIDYYTAFFTSCAVGVSYDEILKAFSVVIDLNTCALNARQALALSEAL